MRGLSRLVLASWLVLVVGAFLIGRVVGQAQTRARWREVVVQELDKAIARVTPLPCYPSNTYVGPPDQFPAERIDAYTPTPTPHWLPSDDRAHGHHSAGDGCLRPTPRRLHCAANECVTSLEDNRGNRLTECAPCYFTTPRPTATPRAARSRWIPCGIPPCNALTARKAQ